MRVQIQLRIVTDDETVLSDDVMACFDKGDDQLEEIGLSLDQAKSVLASAQTRLVAAARVTLRFSPVMWPSERVSTRSAMPAWRRS